MHLLPRGAQQAHSGVKQSVCLSVSQSVTLKILEWPLNVRFTAFVATALIGY